MNDIKSPVSWVGNKTALLPYINAILPFHPERFVDVFGGSGTVILNRSPCAFEVYNDFDGELVNLFRCMRDKTLSFLQELGFLPLNSRDEFNLLKRFLSQDCFDDSVFNEEMKLTEVILPSVNADEIKRLFEEKEKNYDIKRAVAYLKVIRYSYSSGKKSFASQPFDIRKLFHLIWKLHDRMSNTVIENQDFEILIRHYDRPNTVFYCDPPYYETEGMYSACFTKDDHLRLYHVLSSIKGKVLVSYNDCAFIRELYKEFNIIECKRIHSMAQRYKSGAEYPELLIGNFDLLETQRKKPLQLAFDEDDDTVDYEKILKESIIK